MSREKTSAYKSLDPKNERNKVTIHADGSTRIPAGLLTQTEDTAALIHHTDYGYKIISLVPDIAKVYIEVTTLCNFSCTTCIRNSWDDELGKMEIPVFERLYEQLKELPNLESVHFGGFGEPMSHPHIFEMMKSVKEIGLKVELITNGSLLDENNAAQLIDLGLDKLFISLDGPDEESYNDIRQGADYNSVLKNIRKFNQIKKQKGVKHPELAFEFVAMKQNIHKLPELAKMLNELNARYLIVTNVLPYCEELKDEIVYDLDDTMPIFGEDSLKTLVRAYMPNLKFRTERYCRFIEKKALAITREGNIAPCYAFMHSYKCYIYGREKKMHPYHLGNVMDKSLQDIWTDPEYALFRATVKDFNFPSCTDCKLLDGCNYIDNNDMDCWGNSPSCAECLWARGLIVCP